MLALGELHEGAILHTLRLRYAHDAIYTNISSIVLSINPYKMLSCYGPSQIALFRTMLAKANADGGPPEAAPLSNGSAAVNNAPLPPHVYALADTAYSSLLRDGVSQAIIISGESGAGKTEATKLVLQYLAGQRCVWAFCYCCLQQSEVR
jgi:myosin heavy subunit